jgi:uncharacterized membrane protein YqjE
MASLDNTLRLIIIVVLTLIMIPVGLISLMCTMCAFTGTYEMGDRIWFLIGALASGTILTGGIVVIAKLAKEQADS